MCKKMLADDELRSKCKRERRDNKSTGHKRKKKTGNLDFNSIKKWAMDLNSPSPKQIYK